MGIWRFKSSLTTGFVSGENVDVDGNDDDEGIWYCWVVFTIEGQEFKGEKLEVMGWLKVDNDNADAVTAGDICVELPTLTGWPTPVELLLFCKIFDVEKKIIRILV